MAKRFSRGLYSAPIPSTVETSSGRSAGNDGFLILLLLFVLLAASPSLGLDSSYFFIIIMAVIGSGGVKKAFGLSG
jgi:hypothetical protein